MTEFTAGRTNTPNNDLMTRPKAWKSLRDRIVIHSVCGWVDFLAGSGPTVLGV